MNIKNTILTEQNILAFLIYQKRYLNKVDEKYFVSKIGKELFETIRRFDLEGININSRNIAIDMTKKDIECEQEKIQQLFNIDVTESIPFDILYKSLKESYIKDQLENKCLNDLLKDVSAKEFNIEKYYALKDEIELLASELTEDKSVILTAKQMIEKYEKYRLDKHNSFYSTGDSKLDSILVTGFEPGYVNILFARSGVGKTSFALSLISKQINKEIPCIYFSLEMMLDSIVNKLLSQRLNIPFEFFYHTTDSENGFNIDMMKDEIDLEKENLISSPYFRYVDMQSLSLNDVDMLIKRGLDSMNKKYAVVTIDLLTMIKDFNGENKASKYEDAMNKLHEIAKKNNVSIIGVVQTKRLSDKASVKSIDDLDKFRPSIEEIKNAGAIEERARIVLSLFRKKHEASKHFEKDSPELQLIEDIAEVEILKQNLGKVGERIKYLYEGEYSKFTPYLEEE